MIAICISGLAVICGGLVGTILKKKINADIFETTLKVIGVVVCIFGLIGAIQAMVVIKNNKLSVENELFLLVFLTVGAAIGASLKLDQKIQKFNNFIETKFHRRNFSAGFITATLIFTIGAMAVLGPIQAASGKPGLLYFKAAIDAITAVLLASTLGYGVIFAGIPLFLYELFLFSISNFAGDFFLRNEFADRFSMVGNVIIMCIGINFIIDYKKDHIKIINILPALLLVIIYYIFYYYVF